MRKFDINYCLLFLFLGFASCNTTQKSSETNKTEQPVISATANYQVSAVALKEKLSVLAADSLMGRATGSKGEGIAADYIEADFRKNNIKPYFETYRDPFEVDSLMGYNIVGVIEGSDPVLKDEYVVLGAHYDHIGMGKKVGNDSIANGANDDASGTVAVMEIAEQLSKNGGNKRSVIFALFSGEELGLKGSKHLASRLKKEGLDVYVMFNFEMIGVPMKDKSYLAYLTGFERSNLAEKFNEYSSEEVLGFLPQAKNYNLFMRSDNYSFFTEFNIPAQALSTFDFTNYDYYHHVSDESSQMDYDHMASFIESVLPGINHMLNSSEKEIKLN